MDKNKKNESKDTPEPISNIHFNVMPDLENIGKMPDVPSMSGAPVPPVPPPNVQSDISRANIAGEAASRGSVSPRLTRDIVGRRESVPAAPGAVWYKSKKLWLIVAIVAVLAAGGLVAAMLIERNGSQSSGNNQGNQNNVVNTPAVDDNKDTDNDGLTDKEEADLGTDVNHADTDNDGLADGDEVKLFQTSPLTLHSDADRYDDGKEIKDGYTPLTAGDSLLTDSEIQEIVAWFKDGRLHEPTRNLLLTSVFWQQHLPFQTPNQPGPAAGPGGTFTYEDPVYHYQLVVPGEWRTSGENPTNIVFIEENSPIARYIQIQAVVGVNSEGQVSGEGILESELKRLTKIAVNGITVRETTVGGLRAYSMRLESERASSNPNSPKLLSATLEYVVETSDVTFIVTAACTSDTGQTCLPSLESLAVNLEADLRF